MGAEKKAALKRYTHIKPAPAWKGRCGRTCPRTGRSCSREAGHRGPHVSHGLLRRVLAVWEGTGSASTAPPRRPSGRKPVGLRTKGSKGLLERLGSAARFLDAHAEEIALAVFFLAFVWFALDWLLIIMR